MDIGLLAVGRLKAGPERELCDRYLERARKAGGPLGFRAFTVKELAEARATRHGDRMAQEADALVAVAPRGGRIVSLDEAGELVGSEEFARALGRDADAAVPHTTFIIGGPDGLGEKVSRLADRRFSFGRMTWPHQLVRVLLAEQLYRAMTILSGHPYHRA
jgi:23S rRNA (pseudouridine1915-N3)-methyltransferase